MPRDFANSVIYKLARRDGQGEFYIGSTTNIRSRRSLHKHCCHHSERAMYKHIRDNGGFDEWECVPIEQYPCLCFADLKTRERHWIDILSPSLNSNRPTGITQADGEQAYRAQYYAQHREEIKAQRATRKEEIAKYNATYRATHIEEMASYRARYYEQHRDEAVAYSAQYHAQHRDRTNASAREKITCECGAIVSRGGIAEHRKTRKHQKAQSVLVTNLEKE